MRQLTTFLTIVLLLVIAGCITGKNRASKGVVDIIDVRKTKIPRPDLATHKNHDVEVYRTITDGEAYKVTYYRRENDSLKSYGAFYGSNDDMDKAAYEWLNDSVVSFRLYNTYSKKEITFKASGHRGWSDLIVDE